MIRVFGNRDLPVMDIIELQGRIAITPEALTEARAAKEARRAARQQRHAEKIQRLKEAGQVEVSSSTAADRAVHRDKNNGTDSRNAAEAMTSSAVLPSLTSPVLFSSSSSSDDSGDFDDEDDDEGVWQACRTKLGDNKLDSTASTVVEVPLGHVEQDHLSEKRCTLCIDTLRVDGGRSTYKYPLLVLKACSPARMQQLRRQVLRHRHEEAMPKTTTRPPGSADTVAEKVLAAPSSPSTTFAEASSTTTTMLFSEWLQQHPDVLSLNTLYLDDMLSEEETCEGLTGQNGMEDSKNPRRRQREGEAVAEDEVYSPAHSGTPSSKLPTPAYKNYELVGVVRDSVLFNSKPARVFR